MPLSKHALTSQRTSDERISSLDGDDGLILPSEKSYQRAGALSAAHNGSTQDRSGDAQISSRRSFAVSDDESQGEDDPNENDPYNFANVDKAPKRKRVAQFLDLESGGDADAHASDYDAEYEGEFDGWLVDDDEDVNEDVVGGVGTHDSSEDIFLREERDLMNLHCEDMGQGAKRRRVCGDEDDGQEVTSTNFGLSTSQSQSMVTFDESQYEEPDILLQRSSMALTTGRSDQGNRDQGRRVVQFSDMGANKLKAASDVKPGSAAQKNAETQGGNRTHQTDDMLQVRASLSQWISGLRAEDHTKPDRPVPPEETTITSPQGATAGHETNPDGAKTGYVDIRRSRFSWTSSLTVHATCI
ncbi:uncharacterized protein EV422DRAFT_144570 [Fimicolochytrium jonesii]|uniref:uncharacterized protein n=1 Tax=Fimicolochytrium jonesii TaxID=1396493 RepID=UPI0022FE266C|nr:uncharacterized protein EV422DRAFT_144570 [Fimicolochytrium jonesii]KAI8825872.1 hypothetical protein EV422DRAFT_144570 [Fimicolochytrium jonesii]